MISELPKLLRWAIAMGIAFAGAMMLAVYGDALPFGDDLIGAMLRGLVVGAITVGAMRLMELGKWDKSKHDDA